jgi:lipoprotein-anchoring transpeptidase ErfK/SrfK
MRWARAVAVALVVAAARARGEESATRVLVSIPDRKLAVIEDGEVVKVFDVAVGARVSPSPQGVFQVVTRIPNPTWYTPGKVVGPGKANPLGTRWLGLNLKGYGIHGTNVPRSIGRAASHGCIRMRNGDVEELFEMVGVGAVVDLRGAPDEETGRIFRPAPARAVVVVAAVKPAAADVRGANGGE